MAWFRKAREKLLEGALNLGASGHHLRAIGVDMDDAGPAAGAFKIKTITYSGTTVTVTTGTSGATVAHGMTAGDMFDLFGTAGISNVTGEKWTVLASGLTSTQFQFTCNTTPTGTHTANTGYIADLSLEFLSEFASTASGARVFDVEIPTTGRSTTNGVWDLPDVVATSVTGDQLELVLLVKAGTTPGGAQDAEGARRLIMCQHAATPGLTGMPQTPVGGNINVNFATQGVGS